MTAAARYGLCRVHRHGRVPHARHADADVNGIQTRRTTTTKATHDEGGRRGCRATNTFCVVSEYESGEFADSDKEYAWVE
jgi:hypothetical protein